MAFGRDLFAGHANQCGCGGICLEAALSSAGALSSSGAYDHVTYLARGKAMARVNFSIYYNTAAYSGA